MIGMRSAGDKSFLRPTPQWNSAARRKADDPFSDGVKMARAPPRIEATIIRTAD